MEFKDKIKKRILLFAVYVAAGLVLFGVSYLVKDNTGDLIRAAGIAYAVCGFGQIFRNVRLMKDERLMKKREIAEKDERNIWISNRAKSCTFFFFTIFSAIAMIVLFLTERKTEGLVIAYAICAEVIIYYICYLYISHKH